MPTVFLHLKCWKYPSNYSVITTTRDMRDRAYVYDSRGLSVEKRVSLNILPDGVQSATSA